MLAKSRRGGRRIKGVRNSAMLPTKHDSDDQAETSIAQHGPSSIGHDDDVDASDSHSRQSSRPRSGRQPRETHEIQGWPSSSQQTGNWRAHSPPDGGSAPAVALATGSRTSSDGLEGHIASTDLLNPSDALDLLAQVADLDPGRERGTVLGQPAADSRHVDGLQKAVSRNAANHYPPLDDGILTPAEVTYLLRRYPNIFPRLFIYLFLFIFAP